MREIKFEFGFENHAPVRMTLNQITGSQMLDNILRGESGAVKYRRQFTGLLDQNKEEIYEDDIIQLYEYGELYKQVVFLNGAFCVHGVNWDLKRSEVIGNIHENPELLESE